jgi:hypothetical protein
MHEALWRRDRREPKLGHLWPERVWRRKVIEAMATIEDVEVLRSVMSLCSFRISRSELFAGE